MMHQEAYRRKSIAQLASLSGALTPDVHAVNLLRSKQSSWLRSFGARLIRVSARNLHPDERGAQRASFHPHSTSQVTITAWRISGNEMFGNGPRPAQTAPAFRG